MMFTLQNINSRQLIKRCKKEEDEREKNRVTYIFTLYRRKEYKEKRYFILDDVFHKYKQVSIITYSNTINHTHHKKTDQYKYSTIYTNDDYKYGSEDHLCSTFYCGILPKMTITDVKEYTKKKLKGIYIPLSSVHKKKWSRTYMIISLMGFCNDISDVIFSFVWDYTLIPCQSFKYGYQELAHIYIKDWIHQNTVLIKHLKSKEYLEKSKQWYNDNEISIKQMYHDIGEKKTLFIFNYLGIFAIMAYQNNYLSILELIIQTILIHKNDMFVVPLWNKLLYLAITNNDNQMAKWMVNLGANNISLNISTVEKPCQMFNNIIDLLINHNTQTVVVIKTSLHMMLNILHPMKKNI